MNKQSGSVFGGMLLIVGSCIGAGMLGLPVITGIAGFFPSLIMFFLAWAFMTASALLLVEVNGWFSQRVNLLTMVGDTLGKKGKAVCWITYLFLFYALLVAYISGIGSLSTTFFQMMFNVALPAWAGSLFFVVLFGWIVYLGTRRVDLCNRGLMVGKITVFLFLVFIGAAYIQPVLLAQTQAKYALLSLPLLIISFGFHNMIPSLVNYLKGDIRRVRWTIIGGGIIAFAIYMIWEILVLGIVPIGGLNGLVANLKQDKEASQALATMVGSPAISVLAQALAFFAILTSFIAQALSLVHFLADGLRIPYKNKENGWLCVLALTPPLILALIYPQMFFKALNFAGGICTVILFGLLPVMMVWIGRYRREGKTSYEVPGGKLTLIAIFLFALFILFLQLSSMCGASFIPKVTT
jgi:tyrosine-specific transport protein